MRVRFFVGDPNQLSRLHLQPLTARPDAAGARETIEDVLPRIDSPLDAIFGAGDNLARTQHAERGGTPILFGNVVQALDKRRRFSHARFIQALAPSVHFLTGFVAVVSWQS